MAGEKLLFTALSQSLNKLIASSETDFVIQPSKQKSPANKSPRLDSITGEFYQQQQQQKTRANIYPSQIIPKVSTNNKCL